MRLQRALIALLFIFSSHAYADSKSLAESLFDKTISLQIEPLIDRMLLVITREQMAPPKAIEIYRSSMMEMFGSKRYRQAYVDAYQSLFTEEELKVMNDLADHPGFNMYMQKTEKIQEMTYPTFVSLMSEAKVEISKKLGAAGLGTYK